MERPLFQNPRKLSEEVFGYILARWECTKYHLVKIFRLTSIKETFNIPLKEAWNRECQEPSWRSRPTSLSHANVYGKLWERQATVHISQRCLPAILDPEYVTVHMPSRREDRVFGGPKRMQKVWNLIKTDLFGLQWNFAVKYILWSQRDVQYYCLAEESVNTLFCNIWG